MIRKLTRKERAVATLWAYLLWRLSREDRTNRRRIVAKSMRATKRCRDG